MIKGLLISHVVDQENACRVSVVGGCNCTVAFLACSVPDGGLNGLGRGWGEGNALGVQFHANGGLGVVIEFVVFVPHQEVCFADVGVAQ